MKEDNKELIDLIRDGLKNAGDRPYKEGAWEAYQAKYEPARKIRRLAPLWVAAAVAAVVGFTFLFNDGSQQADHLHITETGQVIDNGTKGETDRLASLRPEVEEPVNQSAGISTPEPTEQNERPYRSVPGSTLLAMQEVSRVSHLASLDVAGVESTPVLTRKIQAPNMITLSEDRRPMAILRLDDDLVPGQQVNPNFAYQNDAAQHIAPKKIRLTDRFEFGAFLSPSTTDRSFDLGGGLVFAYRLNDKLAIRTGASFNQYEVGMLGSQVEQVREQKIAESAPVSDSESQISKEVKAFRTNNLFIPNLNAVTGKVQTLDVPLEVRYNLTKDFYATGGVSYAAVLSQERFDHYEESVGIPVYSSASDSEKPVENSVSTVERTVLSQDDNVRTNGFGGFVNFSIGRKVELGKTMKVSVEPFVKLPVGQFKRADMNYTNGGIRIMTSF